MQPSNIGEEVDITIYKEKQMIIMKKKWPLTTNIKNPKWFVVWEEKMPRGKVTTSFRVFTHQQNMEAFIRHLSLDPLMVDLYYGSGRKNHNGRTWIVDSSQQLQEEPDVPEEACDQSDD